MNDRLQILRCGTMLLDGTIFSVSEIRTMKPLLFLNLHIDSPGKYPGGTGVRPVLKRSDETT